MAIVEFFGNYRLMFNQADAEINVDTVGALLNAVADMFPNQDRKEILRASIFINDKAVQGVFRNRKKIASGDKVLMMYPSAGG